MQVINGFPYTVQNIHKAVIASSMFTTQNFLSITRTEHNSLLPKTLFAPWNAKIGMHHTLNTPPPIYAISPHACSSSRSQVTSTAVSAVLMLICFFSMLANTAWFQSFIIFNYVYATFVYISDFLKFLCKNGILNNCHLYRGVISNTAAAVPGDFR